MPTKPELRPTLVDLLTGPSLPAAACAGRSELFDPPDDEELQDDTAYRHAAALEVCEFCPARTACAAMAVEFARLEGARGFVLAGRVIVNRERT